MVAPTELVDGNANRLQAADAALVIEVISPGSRRTDQITKRFEYAAAGIPTYWVLDLGDSPELTANRLVGDVYEVDFRGGGEFKTAHHFDLAIDVDALVRRPRRGPA